MHALDASSLIHAWDTYPAGQFPAVWVWLAEEFAAGRCSICRVAHDEVARRVPDCDTWMRQNDIEATPITEAMLLHALSTKNELGIVEDGYGGGVGENDLLIIASAHEHGHTLVSNEKVQNQPPTKPQNYHIPAVCRLASVSVPCLDFLTLLRNSGRVFE